MKAYVHARLSERERAALDALKRATGLSESDILRRGLELAVREAGSQRSALTLAARSVGRFANGPRDLSTHKKHLEGFGE